MTSTRSQPVNQSLALGHFRGHSVDQQVSPIPKPFGTLFCPSPVERSISQLQEVVWVVVGLTVLTMSTVNV